MTIPENLTHAEVGAFLIAIGSQMIDCDICAEAVLDPGWMSEAEYVDKLAREMVLAESYNGINEDRARAILTTLTLAEAIEFIEPQYTKET